MRYELNDNELELVNGGTYWQTANDSRFLNSLNGSTDRYGAFKIFIDGSGERTKEIKDAWLRLNIICRPSDAGNTYILGWTEITQEQARQVAMARTGHHMTESDWDW